MTLPSTWEPSLISPNTSICSSPPAVPLTARLIVKFTSPGNSPSARNFPIRLPVHFENESEFHTARRCNPALFLVGKSGPGAPGDWKVAQTRGQECPRYVGGFPACGFWGLSSPQFKNGVELHPSPGPGLTRACAFAAKLRR